jgi:tyrosyl-tRNA synthetase
MDEINSLLTRGVENVYPTKDALVKVLRSGKKLKLYQGFDPSMPSLHFGNLVGAMKLRQFQKLGHKVIFLIGDFTGMIGDPTDKTAVRRQLTREEVTKNAETWKKQLKNILDFDGPNAVLIKRNSEWSDKITFKDLIDITSNFTVQQMIERDMFQVRLKEEKPIYLHEFLYPVAQGYDSVAMDVDMEIGGSDQTFNMLTGRSLMRAMKNKEKYVLTTKLMVDKEGKKVGKTTGNALFVSSGPIDFYGGIMSFPDEVLHLAFELLTEVDLKGLERNIKNDPLKQKKRLAYEVVKLVWSRKEADEAQDSFENIVQKGNSPIDPEELNIPGGKTLLDIIGTIVGSKSQAKRLIIQRAVDIDGKIAKNALQILSGGEIIKIGKRYFVKVIV